MSNFSERLNDLIIESKKSVVKIAQEMGLSKQTIYRYLSQDRNPTLDNLLLVANYFKVSVDYLAGRTDMDNFYHEKTVTFPESFKAMLLQQNYTRYRLAKESGINESVILWWIKGKRKPTLESLIIIANTLNCSIDNLLGLQ